MTTEALAPAAAEPAIATGGGREIVLPQVIVDAGPSAVARFLEFFAGRIANARTRAAYGRAVGAVPRVVRGARTRAARHLGAPRRRLHPDAPRLGPHGEAAPGRDPHARRLARRQPGPPGEPRGRGAGAEARRHQGRDAGALAGGSPEAPRVDRHGCLGRAPGPGAALGHALQLRAGERRVDGLEERHLRLLEPAGLDVGVEGSRRTVVGRDVVPLPALLVEPQPVPAPLPEVVLPPHPQHLAARRQTGRALERRLVLAMIKRRPAAAGLPPSTCCHTFRAAGITAYWSNGGTLERAQQIAGHASPKTTKLYDRTADTVTVDDLYRRLPEARITDILLKVDDATRFTEAFTHLRTGEPCRDRIGLLNVLLAEGINLGLRKMAEATSTHGFWELMRIIRWHVEGDTFDRALVVVVEAQTALPMAASWGTGRTASSDGQFFPAAGRGEALNLVNARYGAEPGVKAYSHVSDGSPCTIPDAFAGWPRGVGQAAGSYHAFSLCLEHLNGTRAPAASHRWMPRGEFAPRAPVQGTAGIVGAPDRSVRQEVRLGAEMVRWGRLGITEPSGLRARRRRGGARGA